MKVVARPERLALLADGTLAENCLPAMVERTVYVGATVQVILRLATGETVQAAIPNTGEATAYAQGAPVAAHVPADALRVLAGAPPRTFDGGVPAEPEPAVSH